MIGGEMSESIGLNWREKAFHPLAMPKPARTTSASAAAVSRSSPLTAASCSCRTRLFPIWARRALRLTLDRLVAARAGLPCAAPQTQTALRPATLPQRPALPGGRSTQARAGGGRSAHPAAQPAKPRADSFAGRAPPDPARLPPAHRIVQRSFFTCAWRKQSTG